MTLFAQSTSTPRFPKLTLTQSNAIILCLFLFLFCFTNSIALNHNLPTHYPRSQLDSNHSVPSPTDYACQPIGPCQPCPLDELTNSVCEIYHNRRLVDCLYLGNASFDAILNQTDSDSHKVANHGNQIGAGESGAEFQTWEACERVILKERQDFYEFVLCNLFIAAVSLLLYGFRTKQLVVKQYRNLAARIGILPT